MRRLVRIALGALAVAAPLVAPAVPDAPHWDDDGCAACHTTHNAPGAGLTKRAGNANLCNSCHALKSAGRFGFPWVVRDEAIPGAQGRSHSWSGLGSNRGATTPDRNSSDPIEAAMGKFLDTDVDGKHIKCSTCHDAHEGDGPALSGRGTQAVSAVSKVVSAGGSGVVAVTSVPSTLDARGYLVRITAGGGTGTATFGVSNDAGISWRPDVATAASVTLGDGVVLAFAGTFVATETYSFFVSYPFLQASNAGNAMCLTCHRDRHMYWQDVDGRTDGRLGTGLVLGTTVFSHPVGQPLNANGRGYDRTDVLDANGAFQANGDGNPANDILLDGAGAVTCITCHRVHNAASSSLP